MGPQRRTKQRSGRLRFRVGDRVECTYSGIVWTDLLDGVETNDVVKTGTVVKLHHMEEGLGRVPYQVQLDDGDLIFAPSDTDDCIRASTPEELRFDLGDRVECYCNNGYKQGTITKLNIVDKGVPGRIHPARFAYEIKTDDGCTHSAPVDRDGTIRASLKTLQPPGRALGLNSTIRFHHTQFCLPDQSDLDGRLGTIVTGANDEGYWRIKVHDYDKTVRARPANLRALRWQKASDFPLPTESELVSVLDTTKCVVIKFRKDSGDIREMVATRNLDEVPYRDWPASGVKDHVRGAAIHVYDKSKGGWRSFKCASLVAMPSCRVLSGGA